MKRAQSSMPSTVTRCSQEFRLYISSDTHWFLHTAMYPINRSDTDNCSIVDYVQDKAVKMFSWRRRVWRNQLRDPSVRNRLKIPYQCLACLMDLIDSGQLTHCYKLPNYASRGLTSLLSLRISLCHSPGCVVFTSSGSLHPVPTVFFERWMLNTKLGQSRSTKRIDWNYLYPY